MKRLAQIVIVLLIVGASLSSASAGHPTGSALPRSLKRTKATRLRAKAPLMKRVGQLPARSPRCDTGPGHAAHRDVHRRQRMTHRSTPRNWGASPGGYSEDPGPIPGKDVIADEPEPGNKDHDNDGGETAGGDPQWISDHDSEG